MSASGHPEERRQLADRGRQGASRDANQPELPLGAMNEAARKTLEKLNVDTATHIDDLLDRVEECSSSEIIAALFELELLGLVKQLPGKNFVKVW